MRTTALLGAAALALACGPAMAQSDSNNKARQGDQSMQQQAANQTDQQSSQQMRAMTQQKLRSDLEKAGFSNVDVLDAAYLVQAETSDGNRVMMFINPPSMGGAGGSGSGSSGSSTSGGSGSGSGSSASSTSGG